MPTLRNTICSVFIGRVHKKNNWDEIVSIYIYIYVGTGLAQKKMEQRVPRRQHKIQTPGITQKKECNDVG